MLNPKNQSPRSYHDQKHIFDFPTIPTHPDGKNWPKLTIFDPNFILTLPDLVFRSYIPNSQMLNPKKLSPRSSDDQKYDFRPGLPIF